MKVKLEWKYGNGNDQPSVYGQVTRVYEANNQTEILKYFIQNSTLIVESTMTSSTGETVTARFWNKKIDK